MTYLIKTRIRTRKAMTQIAAFNKYTFDVDPKLTKPQIKQLFNLVYGVSIVKINTHKRPLKVKSKLRQPRYLPGYKRAIIQIEPGKKWPYIKNKFNSKSESESKSKSKPELKSQSEGASG